MTRPNERNAGDADPATPQPPIIVIAPAMAIGSRFYAPVVAAFAEHGWSARALPRRGFERGEPPAARGHDWSYQDEIDVIDRAVAVARAEAPDRPVLVLGHSLGAQLAAGLAFTRSGPDGLVTVGGCLPHYRHYPRFGLDIAVMAALVPPLTSAVGYLPKPAFGAPGPRTMMREWARMVLTGRTPFPTQGTIDTASLVISLEGDTLAPHRGVDAFARELFAPDRVTRWDYRTAEVPAGASNDHIRWVRTPGPVVDRVVAWWQETAAATASGPTVRAAT